MAQITFVDGDVLTATQLNTYCSGEGGAWTSATPTIDQGASTNIAKTVNYSKYGRWGRMIVWNFKLTLTAAGSAGSQVTVTLPVTASATEAIAGSSGLIYDSSTTTSYAGAWAGVSTTTATLRVSDASGSGWGVLPSLALASGDEIRGSIIYEAAS